MRLPGILLCLLFVAPVPLYGTKIARLSLTGIANRAVAVLIVEVLGSSTRVGAAGMVWTDYETNVVDIIRGNSHSGRPLTLSFAGGEAAGRLLRIEGVPQLEAGTRYLIFLDDTPLSPVPAIGWSQGVFRILPAGNGHEASLLSLEGERLAVDAHGSLTRAPAHLPLATAQRIPEPVALNADGGVAQQSRTPQQLELVPLWRDATLHDLRNFIRGLIGESGECRR